MGLTQGAEQRLALPVLRHVGGPNDDCSLCYAICAGRWSIVEEIQHQAATKAMEVECKDERIVRVWFGIYYVI